ncbi:MAG: Zn-dependent hydrolase including glyoxylase [Firmicutes bacterium]|nr:Zn-dependent hydrolase including glyoxylase [Bacillota bacterium]
MKKIIEVCPHVYQVGGGHLSSPDDCLVYLVEGPSCSALIDTGAGKSAARILNNINSSGIDQVNIKYIVATHGHIDHIGGLHELKQTLQAKVIAHQLELPAIEEGLPQLTAASWYGVTYHPVEVDTVLKGDTGHLDLDGLQLDWVHIPGHTKGGIAVTVIMDSQKVLFGQDIHGPFNQAWGSDLKQWRNSMHKLLKLEADILCEGHFGIYSPAPEVRRYIESYLQQYR